LNKDVVTPRAQTIIRFFLPRSAADDALIAIPQIQQSLRTGMREAFTQAGLGPKQDAKTFLESWGWDLADFPTPMQIWHGKEDRLLPYSFAVELSNLIPKAKLVLVNGEGHYSLPINHVANALDSALDLKPHFPK
jgi:pimeloyl-ACP methyl ester carboxylesterase